MSRSDAPLSASSRSSTGTRTIVVQPLPPPAIAVDHSEQPAMEAVPESPPIALPFDPSDPEIAAHAPLYALPAVPAAVADSEPQSAPPAPEFGE